MDKLRHLRRQVVQQTKQKMGLAEETPDDEFESMLISNKEHHDQLAAVAKNLQRFKESTASMVDAAMALSHSLEVFFEPDASTGGAPSDPTSLVLARTFSSSLGEIKNATLPAVHAMLDASAGACTRGLAAYGDIAPQVKGRKDLMLEADAYKSKVDQLRAAPPKNDPDKLPRNEEKLAKACADLAKANNDLIEKLVAMERAKASLLSKDLRNMVDASYLLFQQAEVRLENVMAKMSEDAEPTPGKVKPAAAAPPPRAATFDDDDAPGVSFTPATHVSHAPVAAAPTAHVTEAMGGLNPFGSPVTAGGAPADAASSGGGDAFGEFDFGVPPPPPGGSKGAVMGVDDFDSFA